MRNARLDEAQVGIKIAGRNINKVRQFTSLVWQFISLVPNIHWGTDAEAETPILWPPDMKNWLTGEEMRFPASFPDAEKDGRQEEKGNEEDGMVGWRHRLYGHEFEQYPRVGDGQGSLACCSPWGGKESDTTEQLKRTLLKVTATI